MAANLNGTYRAWLAHDTMSPSNRFVQSSDPYVRTDGMTVANNYADLTDGTIANPINKDENESDIEDVIVAWTNVNTDGTTTGTGMNDSCQNWQSATRGQTGNTTAASSQWTEFGCRVCTTVRRLYCFEQPQSPPPTVIPTLTQWGMIIMAGFLGLVALYAIRRRLVKH